MDFTAIAEKFSTSSAGTDSFKELHKNLSLLIAKDNENAALYFVLAIIAQAYVRRYEDQAVPSDFAQRVKARFLNFIEKIQHGLASDSATRLTMLNEITCEYELTIAEF